MAEKIRKIKGIPLHDSLEAPRDVRAFEVKLLDPREKRRSGVMETGIYIA